MTQSAIALMSVGAGVYIMIVQALWVGEGVDRDVPQTLASMIFLVLGFYFARTNHDKVGGVGASINSRRGE